MRWDTRTRPYSSHIARWGGAFLGALGTLRSASGAPVLVDTPRDAKVTIAPDRGGTRAARRCSVGELSAIRELACDIGAALGPLGQGVLIRARAPLSDRTVSRNSELSERLARALAAALGSGARALPGALSPTEARPTTTGDGPLVVITPRIVAGEIRLEAEGYAKGSSFWDRVRTPGAPAAAPAIHASARRALDGEVGAFLAPVAVGSARVLHVSVSTTDVVALACTADGAGSLDAVLVGRRKIVLGKIRNGTWVPRADATWSALSPVAPMPLREPIAAARFDSDGFITVGTTDRASGFRLSPALLPAGKLDEILPWRHVGCLGRAGIALGLAGPCQRGETSRIDASDVADADAIASGTAVDAEGRWRAVVAWRNAETRDVTLKDDAGHVARIADVGAELALGDVDLDGVPELVAATNTENPQEDAIIVRSWDTGGNVRERSRFAVPEGVHALAVCPPIDARLAPILIATGRGLWVVH